MRLGYTNYKAGHSVQSKRQVIYRYVQGVIGRQCQTCKNLITEGTLASLVEEHRSTWTSCCLGGLCGRGVGTKF